MQLGRHWPRRYASQVRGRREVDSHPAVARPRRPRRQGAAYVALCEALAASLSSLPGGGAPHGPGEEGHGEGVHMMWAACQAALARELVAKQLALESALDGPHSTRVLALGVVQSEPFARETNAFGLLAELGEAMGRRKVGR